MMGEEGPSKSDIAAVFKRLRSIPTNKICFDCGTNNPTWSSVTFGVFICIDCSAVHRSLGVHLTFVRSTQLDTNWTWLQIRAMQCGGNGNATAFFRQHNCNMTDAQQKYKSRAASLYREKLHHMAAAVMRSYGTELHLESSSGDQGGLHSPQQKEVDFFQEHSDAALFSTNQGEQVPAQKIVRNGNSNNDPEEGPNVEAALSTSPGQASKMQEVRKSTIGARKPVNKKSGLGAKKGLGAQRVKTNFSQIEKEAQMADQRREEFDSNRCIQEKFSKDEEEKQMASVRLAYKDLSNERHKQEQKMMKADPKKAEQFERLGMGFGGRSAVSHSVASEMKTIDQELPSSASAAPSRFNSDRRNSFEEEFEFLGISSSSSKPLKFSDSSFSKKPEIDSYKSSASYTSSNNNQSRSSKHSAPSSASNSDCAQKKFGNAKAISSDQYFGDSRDSTHERESNLSRFQGSSGISSADYFGTPQQKNNSKSYDYNGPNLSEIKDGVKDGVNRVAGKLSNMASGVMNSFQDRYGY